MRRPNRRSSGCWRRRIETAARFALALTSIAGIRAARADADRLEIARFSVCREGGPLPPGWESLEFRKIPRHTVYSLVRDGDSVVVRAASRASASGLVRRIAADPRRHPIVEWRWKVDGLIDGADVHTRSGDDYPARLYITFAVEPSRLGWVERAKYEAVRLLYGEAPPLAAINYIWEGRAPLGTIVSNAYTSRVKMIVVESGPAKVGRWVAERRNVLADYRAAFGEDPPQISGVAIMTDTDNTGGSAVAYYGDVFFDTDGARIE
jgi:hypothetical protein